jgi:SAM-dependent methyltransferase
VIQSHVSSLPPTVNVLAEFPSWVVQCCDGKPAVLEVGAGRGKDGEAAIIREKVPHLVGIDPDAGILENSYLDERYQTSIEVFARDRSACFDCIYSIAVLEHVTQPQEFFAACRSLLRPGGMLLCATPNLWHYFGVATQMSERLGIQDWLLERLIGCQHKESYHFRARYRANSIRKIKRVLAQTGFSSVEFRCFDHPQEFEYVFPVAARWFPASYSRAVYFLRAPALMGLIMFRATA